MEPSKSRSRPRAIAASRRSADATASIAHRSLRPEPRVRELLAETPDMPATVLAQRVGLEGVVVVVP
jgi:hypothetical protein